MYYRTGPFKGADFVHFYTMGNLVTEGQGDLLYDRRALRTIQSQLVPVAKDYWFIPVNGPQTALLFAGLARLPYLWAALVWGLLTIAGYVACVWMVWRRCPSLRPYDGVMLPAALGFIPLYVLSTSGQTSVLPLVCLTGAYLAFKSDSKWWAGVMLGSLIIKPHFGLAVGVVMLACREWRVVGGAILGAVAQWGLSVLVLGPRAAGGLLRCAHEGSRISQMFSNPRWRVFTHCEHSGCCSCRRLRQPRSCTFSRARGPVHCCSALAKDSRSGVQV